MFSDVLMLVRRFFGSGGENPATTVARRLLERSNFSKAEVLMTRPDRGRVWEIICIEISLLPVYEQQMIMHSNPALKISNRPDEPEKDIQWTASNAVLVEMQRLTRAKR